MVRNIFKYLSYSIGIVVLLFVALLVKDTFTSPYHHPQTNNNMSITKSNKLSEDLLLAVKMEENTDSFLSEIEDLDLNEMLSAVNTDKKRIAFWVNIYNVYYQILNKQHNLKNPEIYAAKEIKIAGLILSLDDIEHGILRRYRHKYSLGYFSRFWVNSTIKKLAVHKMDYRIHFALNCGAVSCPSIAFYDAENIDAQLDKAAHSFLPQETQIDHETKVVYVSRLFYWFMADFGGKKGTKKIIDKYLETSIIGYTIKYNTYDWSEDLSNFYESRF
jgi:hypothetical protein